MKNNYSLYILTLLALTVCACQKDDLAFDVSVTPVVSGYLYAGKPIDSLRVVASAKYGGDTLLNTLDDLEIVVSDGISTFNLINLGDGYYTHHSERIEAGRSYSLSFTLEGVTISSETFVPEFKAAVLTDTLLYREQIVSGGGFGGFNPGEVEENIQVTWDNSESNYYFVEIENIESEPEYINTFLQDLFQDGELPGRPLIRSEPQIVDFHVIDNRRDIQQFGRHRVIVYRLNAEYAALYETIGNSSLSIQAAPTNIVNGLGIFTGISTDTLYFTVAKQ